jgi:predicted hydrocarbon binding protein
LLDLPTKTMNFNDRLNPIILSGMEEILGHERIRTALSLAWKMDTSQPDPVAGTRVSSYSISRMQASLDDLYGFKTGQGLAVRSGRASFKHILREFGLQMGVTGLDFRLLPLPARLNACSRSLAALFNEQTSQHVSLDSDDECITWKIERCPFCRERHSGSPACHLVVGLLQEAFNWSSAGRIFQVEETRCMASGDPFCLIRINKHPIT